MSSNMREIWFIQAHRSTVNSVAIVETFIDHPLSDQEGFLLSCANDCNILLHRLSTGQKVGQFGQSSWNIYDMSTIKRRPNYDRDWLNAKKAIWFKFVMERLREAESKGLIAAIVDEKKVKPRTWDQAELQRLGFTDENGQGSLNDPNSDNDNIGPDDYQSDEDQFKGKKLGGRSHITTKKENGGRN